MDFNHDQHPQQHQRVPGTLVNVLSVRDIDDNELVLVNDRQDVACVEAVDNGEDAMMALIRHVPDQAQEMIMVVGEVPDPAQEDIIITDVVCENYDIDAAYSDVC